MSSSDASALSPEEIVELFPRFVEALEDVGRQRGVTPAELQSEFWHRAVHSR